MVAIVVGFGLSLLFFFVPETFWDRTPRAKHITRPSSGSRGVLPSLLRSYSKFSSHHVKVDGIEGAALDKTRSRPDAHVAFEENEGVRDRNDRSVEPDLEAGYFDSKPSNVDNPNPEESQLGTNPDLVLDAGPPSTPKATLRPPNSRRQTAEKRVTLDDAAMEKAENEKRPEDIQPTGNSVNAGEDPNAPDKSNKYTEHYRFAPPKTHLQTLRIYSGRLTYDHWLRVAFRPFILFAYPAILWSALIYSLSIGWLIVLSESISDIYKSRDTYNFTSLQAGLVYLSPFIGGVLGTAVAGKFSDVVVRFMSRRNDGVYEPEFRLVMAIPVAITTTLGLMGFGWSAEERDNWIVPTFFFGVISFGCSLGSTTSITFAVDSYRQYAGEALVTLNFSKSEFSPLYLLIIVVMSWD
jgi:Major Facilitator Superfamily